MKIDLKEKNIGGVDRKLRIIGGLSLMVTGCLIKNKLIKSAGCVFAVTGLMQKCVFYDILGINTYEDKQISLEENE